MDEPSTLRVCVVTGSRAEFGLLEPVMRAVRDHEMLDLRVVVAGSHLLEPALTVGEVERAFDVAARVPMQGAAGDKRSRLDDARAVGRGVGGFADAFDGIDPGWVVVLGDRIEAFAAASAAAIGGIALAHIHGGDRAEGVADEAMRHAITKLANLHLAATESSAGRIVRMGEPADRVVVTGSPAVDALAAVAPLDDDLAAELSDPSVVVLMHPSGLDADEERLVARNTMGGVAMAESDGRVLGLHPNHDPGRDEVLDELVASASRNGWRVADHLPRERFVGLLKRLATRGGVLVGNSSAGLIEAAAVGLGVVNVGVRQGGRERAANVIDVEGTSANQVSEAIHRARELRGAGHPYGDGHAGDRIADALASHDPRAAGFARKRNAY